MPPVPAAESGAYRNYTKTAGSEPLPGYRLLAPLGRGGFGEVWKCEAPGGLHKAVKFVGGEAEDGRGGERFGQELAAFEQIKAIRHPFLLTLERVEQISGELIMVMELADRQLQDRFNECRTCGQPGIPRDELLAYFADAAEALDIISAKHNLQHLDIKPANLFLVAGHVKVGDYGLVSQLGGSDPTNRGLTPRYVSPEVLHGGASSRSDQYSLALVYQELLTGQFAYSGRTPQQLMLQHVSAQPNLASLPKGDQPVVARALAKKPEDRYPSCLAFVQALMSASRASSDAAMNFRLARVDRSVAEMSFPQADTPPAANPNAPTPAGRGGATTPTTPIGRPPSQSFTLPATPPLTIPGGNKQLPKLVATARAQPVSPPPPEPPIAEEVDSGAVVLDLIRPIVTVARLVGQKWDEPKLDAPAFARLVFEAATPAGQNSLLPGDVDCLPDGGWRCEFPSNVPATVMPLKLAVVVEQWGLVFDEPEPDAQSLILRRVAGSGGFFGGKKYGYEVTLHLPARPGDEVALVGRVFGTPDSKLAREAPDAIPKILAEMRSLLSNGQPRRKQPRVPFDRPITLYPIRSDSRVDEPLRARCRDVSPVGIGLFTAVKLRSKYLYAAFDDLPATAGHAVLLQLARTKHDGDQHFYGTLYRTDV